MATLSVTRLRARRFANHCPCHACRTDMFAASGMVIRRSVPLPGQAPGCPRTPVQTGFRPMRVAILNAEPRLINAKQFNARFGNRADIMFRRARQAVSRYASFLRVSTRARASSNIPSMPLSPIPLARPSSISFCIWAILPLRSRSRRIRSRT